MFDRNKYLNQLQSGSLVTNAPWVEVSLPPDNLPDVWLAVGIWHLTPEENGGNHNVYVDVLDTSKQPLPPDRLGDKRLAFGWEGQRPDEPAPAVKFEKQPPEPAANLPIWMGQEMAIWIESDRPISNIASNLHTDLPDQPPGNTRGHHSYYVVFAQVAMPTTPVELSLEERVRKLEAEQVVTNRRLAALESK
jgi:hypothetical protein